MLPELNIGNIHLSTYWMIYVLGTAAMSIMNIRRRKKIGIGIRSAVLLGIYTALSGLAGAKLLYILENLGTVIKNGLTLGGVSFYGTVFFMPAALCGAAAVMKKERSAVIDFTTPPILLMLAFMRIGCFLNGCCGGISADIFGLHISSIPTQLIELAFDIAIMILLLLHDNKKQQPGVLYPLFMISYGLVRFFIEFIRIRNEVFFGISNGQIFSLISICVGIAAYLIIKRINAKK